MGNNLVSTKIIPTDVKVYAEGGGLYLDYIGQFKSIDGSLLNIHLPKISLVIDSIERNEEFWEIGVNGLNVYAKNKTFFDIELLERTVTKEQLEKELGYKINIKE